MKTVLITGAHGFIGRYCAREFSSQEYRVMGIGHGTWDDSSVADVGIDFWLEGDITLEQLALLPWNPDIIVHAAGSGSVTFSLLHPMQDFERSVTSTLVLLEYARLASHAPRIILISSAAVYGSTKEIKAAESGLLHPKSPYGVHKCIAEQLCREYQEHFEVESSVIRFYSVYGPGLRKQLLWEACRRISAAEPNETLEFYGTGNETRDWLHVQDAALLIRLVGEHVSTGLIVEGGTWKAIAVCDILKNLVVMMGWEGKIGFNGIVRSGDPEHLCADGHHLGYLGWNSSISLSEGLAEYVAWFRGSV
jgi:UDP-glucose 4-epimerase